MDSKHVYILGLGCLWILRFFQLRWGRFTWLVSLEQEKQVYKGLINSTFEISSQHIPAQPRAYPLQKSLYKPLNSSKQDTMAFHLSAQDLRIEDNHNLVGQLQNTEGEFVDASINLDEVLGNEDGLSRLYCS